MKGKMEHNIEIRELKKWHNEKIKKLFLLINDVDEKNIKFTLDIN